jgi:hypothetical protein
MGEAMAALPCGPAPARYFAAARRILAAVCHA